jgi:GT2 family glycosyltransferase
MPDPLVSVIIPTYARPQSLKECLVSLTQQTMPKDQFDVVIVDDGSPTALDSIVMEFMDRLTIRLIRQENAGPAAARNRGIRETSARLVAFTDDDCRPHPQWLELLLAAQRDHPGALVGGSTVNGLPNDLFATTSQFIVDLVYEHFNAVPENAYFLASNNILCPRNQFLVMGGFDLEFTKAGAEDRDFCDRWRATGLQLVWEPNALIYHYHSQSLRRFIDLHYRYGRGAYLYQSKRRYRGTGTMKDDMKFHSNLPKLILQRLRSHFSFWRSAQIILALFLWQIANAAGFFFQLLKSKSFERTS